MLSMSTLTQQSGAGDPRANAVALFAGRVVGATVMVGVVSLAAYRLDGAQFGIVASTMAAGFLANTLVTWGTDTVITRAIAAGRADAGAIAGASLGLQLGAVTVLVAAALVAVAAGADIALLVQAIALVPLAVLTVTAAIVRGRQRMGRLLLANAAGAAATALAAIGLFRVDEAAWVPIAATGLGAGVSAVVLLVFTASAIERSRRSIAVALVRESGPFAAMVVLAAVGAQVGPIVVELAGDESAGGYGVAVRVNEAARIVPASAMAAFFPAMLSGLHRTERYRRWLRLLVGYAVGATAVLVAFAEPLNRIVFDHEPGAAALIRILAAGLLITVVRLALSFELIAAGRERAVVRSALAGAVITVAGGFAVASWAGTQGVAWAQLAGLVAATALLAVERSSQTG